MQQSCLRARKPSCPYHIQPHPTQPGKPRSQQAVHCPSPHPAGSSEALLSGQRPPFALLVQALQGGQAAGAAAGQRRRADVPPVVSECFVVSHCQRGQAMRRSQGRGCSESLRARQLLTTTLLSATPRWPRRACGAQPSATCRCSQTMSASSTAWGRPRRWVSGWAEACSTRQAALRSLAGAALASLAGLGTRATRNPPTHPQLRCPAGQAAGPKKGGRRRGRARPAAAADRGYHGCGWAGRGLDVFSTSASGICQAPPASSGLPPQRPPSNGVRPATVAEFRELSQWAGADGGRLDRVKRLLKLTRGWEEARDHAMRVSSSCVQQLRGWALCQALCQDPAGSTTAA